MLLRKKSHLLCAREFATNLDSTVFAAAVGHRLHFPDRLDFRQDSHHILCFYAVAAFFQAPETGLVFIQASDEHVKEVCRDIHWQCLNDSNSVSCSISPSMCLWTMVVRRVFTTE